MVVVKSSRSPELKQLTHRTRPSDLGTMDPEHTYSRRDRNRRSHNPEEPRTSTLTRPTDAPAVSASVRRGKGAVEASVRTGIEDDLDVMDGARTDEMQDKLCDVSGAPRTMRPPHQRFHRRNGRTFSSHYREHDTEDDHEQQPDFNFFSGVSFGSPIGTSSSQNVRRTGHAQHNYNPFYSGTNLATTTSTTSPHKEIMAGPVGFTPSEMDAYLGIQVACELIATTHGFQGYTVFKIYREVNDLLEAEEIVIGMKRAAEKDARERITKVREKAERIKTSRMFDGSSSCGWGGGQRWKSRRSYDARDEENDLEERDPKSNTIYEEEEDDPRVLNTSTGLARRNIRDFRLDTGMGTVGRRPGLGEWILTGTGTSIIERGEKRRGST